MNMMERNDAESHERCKRYRVQLPFPRMKYEDAMDRFGSDKPDTRFEMELKDLSEVVEECGFKVFASAVENGGQVKAINVKGAASKLLS